MKIIALIVLITALTGCGADISGKPVTERRLPDLNSTMAYASDAEDTTAKQSLLAEFSTKFNKDSRNRAENIALAANAIDKTVVYPGETFSFNETVGPTNAKTGYKRSKIFVRGKEYNGVGGGVCQVSSTLYNAVKTAGLNVTERHPHSRSVSYVQKNNDAAVSYGGIDFKFENDMNYPIIILSDILDGEIKISIEAL